MTRLLIAMAVGLILASTAPFAAFTALPLDWSKMDGIWISRDRIKSLPDHGPAWEGVRKWAKKSAEKPSVADQDTHANVIILAKAMVWVRSGEPGYREEVILALRQVQGSEMGARTLALGREIPAYVIAADLLGITEEEVPGFKKWLQELSATRFENQTLASTHERRPNNWGTHSGAARLAIALYLKDESEVTRAARIFKGWLGDREAWSKFKFGRLDWQGDPLNPLAINAKGASGPNGENLDGLQADEQRRCCKMGFTWPPPKENYVWEGLQGALVQAEMLSRLGYDTWNWSDKALLRAVRWLNDVANYPAQGDDTWQIPLINHHYDTSLAVEQPTRPGKNVGFTDWTHPSER